MPSWCYLLSGIYHPELKSWPVENALHKYFPLYNLENIKWICFASFWPKSLYSQVKVSFSRGFSRLSRPKNVWPCASSSLAFFSRHCTHFSHMCFQFPPTLIALTHQTRLPKGFVCMILLTNESPAIIDIGHVAWLACVRNQPMNGENDSFIFDMTLTLFDASKTRCKM